MQIGHLQMICHLPFHLPFVNDLSILVIGRDKEINEVNNTIVSLENKLKTSLNKLNQSLKEIIMCMNSERVHKSMHMENTSGIIKPESGDQSRLNQPDNYNYIMAPK